MAEEALKIHWRWRAVLPTAHRILETFYLRVVVYLDVCLDSYSANITVAERSAWCTDQAIRMVV